MTDTESWRERIMEWVQHDDDNDDDDDISLYVYVKLSQMKWLKNL